MRLGFNNNIPYKGMTLHIQTEDSGRSKPVITTLLYKDGTILCSSKLVYADMLTADDLDALVDDLMKEQHKGMLNRLKSGEFDYKLSPAARTTIPEATDTSRGVKTAATTSTTHMHPVVVAVPTIAPSIDDAVRSFFGI